MDAYASIKKYYQLGKDSYKYRYACLIGKLYKLCLPNPTSPTTSPTTSPAMPKEHTAKFPNLPRQRTHHGGTRITRSAEDMGVWNKPRDLYAQVTEPQSAIRSNHLPMNWRSLEYFTALVINWEGSI